MNDVAETRQAAVDQLLAQTQSILNKGSLNREMLGQIKVKLEELASNTEFWSLADYAEPNEEENQNRFHIASLGGDGITLYLNVMRPGKKIPPHDHTTWACVAAVSGVEMNTLYDRLDDGSVEGRSDIREREVVELGPGTSVALMPDDIHSVEIRNQQVIRHLHFYGRPMETLTGRKKFDIEAGTYTVMDIGVKTKI